METIYSNIISTTTEMLEVQSCICDVLRECNVKFVSLSSDNMSYYYYVKSHRSNVTEGNTTNVGEFTELVHEWEAGNAEYVLSSKIYDESYEIANLTKAYEYLKDEKELNLNALQNAHRILGRNIFKNNMVEVRGRLKKINNYVPFNYKGIKYLKYFQDFKDVRLQLKNLFEMFHQLPETNVYQIFAKYIILQVELIVIHPFNDGNGRVSRALSESYLEKKGITPYTPYSTKYKQAYQQAMGEYSIFSIEDIKKGYSQFAYFIALEYPTNVEDLLRSVNKLKSTI